MTCQHCVATVTRTLQAADAAVVLEVDLPAHRLVVHSRTLADDQIEALLETAGYTPRKA